MLTTSQDFSEFIDASQVQVTTEPVLDEIGSMLKDAHAAILEIQIGARKLVASLGDSYIPSEIRDMESCSEVAKEVWNTAEIRFQRKFLEPKNLTLNYSAFLTEALDLSDDYRHSDERSIKRLLKWDTGKVLAHFAAEVGDEREFALRQLRLKACEQIYRWEEGDPLCFYPGLHESSYGDGSQLRLTYSPRSAEGFSAVVKYIVHLSTGLGLAEIEFPCIYGYSDGSKSWPRSEVFKKQKSPFPGARSLRFTANRSVNIELEPSVQAMFFKHWTEYKVEHGL